MLLSKKRKRFVQKLVSIFWRVVDYMFWAQNAMKHVVLTISYVDVLVARETGARAASTCRSKTI